MEFFEQQIKGVWVIELKPYQDSRGFFMRTYDAGLFEKPGINMHWIQENHSRSERKGIIRGLHFQREPFSEAKLVRCIRGEIFDVAVDLRKGSPTFGKWLSVILSEENRKMVLIPRGFAHGFCSLTDNCEVVYKVDNVYSPGYEMGLLWNDPDLQIEWPLTDPILSQKDMSNMTFKQYLETIR